MNRLDASPTPGSAPPADAPTRPALAPAPSSFRPGPHRVALLAAAFTLPLLFVGGSVTSYGVGMAVPDWPTTFGMNMFLYNFWNAPFGVQVEHTHRLYGAAVGLATIVLALWLWVADSRRSLKVLGGLTLLAVIIQGIMGGLRVSQISTTLAAVHGCIGQAVFGLMVVLCVLTGRVWHDTTTSRADTHHFRAWMLASLGLVYGQIVVGAWFRHFKSVPVLFAHIGLALVVLGLSHALSARVRRAGDEGRGLRASTFALALGATLQIVLGLLALAAMLPLGGNPRVPTLWDAMSRTAHQTNGALLLAAAIVAALRAFRSFGFERALSPTSAARRSDDSGPAPRAVEALA